ncbi:LuxR C-terminal-related transcriptional regulator [Pseudarthrobacter sp. J1738]|uniref:LuxR C-terminal-related transcriptional regulator n=1 Tax=Pseudarthrobacter sp. J1738 TaxID=3420446 RepID=UPI003D2C5956
MNAAPLWPVVGRKEAIEMIAEGLSENRSGALITGEAGSGKTFLAQEALKDVREHGYVVSLRGSHTLANTPYGALNVLLRDVDSSYLNHPVLVLSGLTRLLAEHSDGQQAVIFVDNAVDIDQLSAVALAQLARNGAIQLILTATEPASLPHAFLSLRDEGLVTNVELRPLTLTQTREWLAEALQAPCSQAAVRALWKNSGGNVHHLKLLSQELLESGALSKAQGNWILSGEVSVHSRAVTELIVAKIGRLDEGEHRILDIVALAESVPLEVLLRLGAAHEIDSLEEKGLLELDHRAPRHARIHSPLLAGVVRSAVPQGRSNHLRALVIEAFQGDTLQPDIKLALAVWGLDCGAALTTAETVESAGLANDASKPNLALRLIRSLLDDAQTGSSAAEEIRSLLLLGKIGQARLVLGPFRKVPRPLLNVAQRVRLLLAGSSVLLATQGGGPGAAQQLDRARKEFEMAAKDPALAREDEAIFEQLLLSEAGARSYSGDYATQVKVLTDLFSQPVPRSSVFRLLGGSMLCEALAVTGKMEQARCLAEELLPECHRPESVAVAVQLAIPRIRYALLWGGHLETTASTISLGEQSAARTHYQMFNATELPAAIVAAAQGKAGVALGLLNPAIGQLRVGDAEGVLALACSAAAYAHALNGNKSESQKLLAEAAAQDRRATYLVERTAQYFAALARMINSTGLDTAPGSSMLATELLSMAGEEQQRGATTLELYCLSAALRCAELSGNLAVARRLSEASVLADGPFAQLCGKFARAVLAQDPSMLVAVALEAAEQQNHRFALDVARLAELRSVALQDRNAQYLAKRLADQYRHVLGVRSVGSEDMQPLTARELEIARIAAHQASNREIASQLHVSVRTVEGHLYRIFRKLKISERSELLYSFLEPETV